MEVKLFLWVYKDCLLILLGLLGVCNVCFIYKLKIFLELIVVGL